MLFAFAHFKPFNPEQPLLIAPANVQATFESHTFDARSTEILNNWEELHECMDAKDAERMKKQAAMAKASRLLTNSLQGV